MQVMITKFSNEYQLFWIALKLNERKIEIDVSNIKRVPKDENIPDSRGVSRDYDLLYKEVHGIVIHHRDRAGVYETKEFSNNPSQLRQEIWDAFQVKSFYLENLKTKRTFSDFETIPSGHYRLCHTSTRFNRGSWNFSLQGIE